MASSGVINAINKRNPRNLYQHQNEALTALDKLDTLGSYSTLLVLPTGAGKTYTASTWLLAHALDKGKKVLWMAHRHMLLDQAAESFKNFAYLDAIPNKGSFYCRIISGADHHQRSSDINAKDDLLIVSKDSIRSNLERLDSWLKGEDEIYFVVDEAHHSTAKTYQRVIKYIESKGLRLKIIGLTATPTRTFEPEQGLLAKIYTDGVTKNGKIFNNAGTPNRLGMVYNIGLKKLIERRILSDPIFEECKTGKNLGEIIERLGKKVIDKIQTADILPKEIQESMVFDKVRNALIVNEYKKNAARYGKTLVFAMSIEHAKLLTERFNKEGIKAAYVVSGTPHFARNQIYDDYRSGNLQVLVNMNILTEGTDLPMTQTVFLTRQTTSTILMTQMIGRALRGPEAGGTAEAYIVSFIDNWNERIMWVVPETVYNAEIGFPDDTEEDTEENQTSEASPEAEDEEIIYISREKILEFAKILNEAIDTTELEALPFIERIPLGMYAFEYESKEDGNTEGNDVSYQVMVYDSTKDAYEKFMAALPDLFKDLGRFAYEDDSQEYLLPDTLRKLLDYCKKKFFSGEMIPSYYEDDIKHIIEYYAQKEACPKFYTFAQVDRERLDVTKVAQDIWTEDLGEKAKANYLNELWKNGDKNIWRIFFVDKRYFLRMVEIELTKLAHPEIYADYKKLKTTQTADPADFEAIELLPTVNFKTVDDLFDKLAKSTDGQEKLAIKNKILAALSKLKEQAQQNRDADNMKKVGEYYGKIHEHDEESRCDALAKEFAKEFKGEPIPDTNLTWRLDDNGTLIISGTGNMKDWYTEKNPAPWYGHRMTIKKVIIEDGVTSIGEDAFADCESLTSVAIPNSVMSIGDWAFDNCASLTEITIPNSVTTIYDGAFRDCKSLKSITIPDSVIKIGRYAFSYCDLLKEIVIPDSVTSIGKYAFVGCESLTSVVIPNSVTSIGNGAFVWCESLTSVTLPDNFVFMKGAFVGCTSLKKINQPSLKDFFCDNLFVYHKRSDGLEINSFIGTTSKVVIPDSVTSIGDGAFYGCTSLTEITIPDSVTSIGYGAFYVCTSLTEITIPDSVYSIGGKSFGFCKSLTSITLPDNIKNLDNGNNFGKAVFVGCTSLKKIDQPSKVIFCDDSFVYEKAPEGTRINSFIGTTPTVDIPRSVTSIGESAFECCESLTKITIPPNITKICGNIFFGCNNLKTIRYTKIYRNRMEVLKRKLSTGNDAELILY